MILYENQVTELTSCCKIPTNLHRQFLILIWHTIFTAIELHGVCVGSLSSLKWIWTLQCSDVAQIPGQSETISHHPLLSGFTAHLQPFDKTSMYLSSLFWFSDMSHSKTCFDFTLTRALTHINRKSTRGNGETFFSSLSVFHPSGESLRRFVGWPTAIVTWQYVHHIISALKNLVCG